MPGYAGTGRATPIRDNQQIYLFKKELNVTGRASIAVQPQRINRSFWPSGGASFQLYFTDVNGNPADPGVFEVDIQTSDIDQDTQYCTATSFPANASLNASFVAHVELPSFYAKFVRAFVKTLTNPVYTTLLVTH
jgi:hypothetical protein